MALYRIEQFLTAILNAWLLAIREDQRVRLGYYALPRDVRRIGERPLRVQMVFQTVVTEPYDVGEYRAAELRKTITVCNICEALAEWPTRAIPYDKDKPKKEAHLRQHALKLWPLDVLQVWNDAAAEHQRTPFEGFPLDNPEPMPVDWVGVVTKKPATKKGS